MNTVTEVSIKKKGVNEKTGKAWTMFNVALDDGRIASGFTLVKVGDTVDTEQKGEFLNYFPVKDISPKQSNGVAIAPQPVARSAFDQLDQRQRAIIRQHSQSMAIEVLKLKVTLNELTTEDITPAKLTKLAEYFDADVLGVSK